MTYLLLLHSSIFFGFEVSRLTLPRFFDIIDVISLGIPVGFILTSWIFYFLRSIIAISKTIVFLVSFLLYVTSFIIHVKVKTNFKIRAVGLWSLIVITLLSILYYFCVYFSYLNDAIYSSSGVLSDLPVHMSIISSLYYGVNSKNNHFTTPFFSNEKLCYSFLPDFFSYVLVCGGASLRISLSLPVLLLFISILLTLQSICNKFDIRSDKVTAVSILLFFFSGGFGWKYFFKSECDADYLDATHFLCNNKTIFWINPFFHWLLPQKGGIFSFTIVLYAIEFICLFIETNFIHIDFMVISGILTGLLPVVCAHSFISVIQYAFFACLLTFPYSKKNNWLDTINKWAIFGGAAIVTSLYQIYKLSPNTHRTLLRFGSLCDSADTRSFRFMLIWWDSLSTFIPIAILGVWFVCTKKQLLRYTISFICFLISNIILYQPFPIDNTKVLFTNWFFYACILVSKFLYISYCYFKQKKYEMCTTLLIAIAATMFLSSFINLVTFFSSMKPMFEKHHLNVALWVVENVKSNAVFLSSTWHSNTIMTLAGRSLVLGYTGWADSHGMDTQSRYNIYRTMMDNLSISGLFQKHNVDYVVSKMDDNLHNFDVGVIHSLKNWLCIFDHQDIRLYKLIG